MLVIRYHHFVLIRSRLLPIFSENRGSETQRFWGGAQRLKGSSARDSARRECVSDKGSERDVGSYWKRGNKDGRRRNNWKPKRDGMKHTSGSNGSIQDALVAARRRAKFYSFMKSKPALLTSAAIALLASAAASAKSDSGQVDIPKARAGA
jgi:hypothetical protein